jgi:hypothetical protein
VSRLPARRDQPGVLPASRDFAREVAEATREHQWVAEMRAAVDQADTEAFGRALDAALSAELALFDHGLRVAGGSAAKSVLVARKLELFEAINNQRLRRRFGA